MVTKMNMIMWPRKWPQLSRFLRLSLVVIFLGARWRWLWTLSIIQLSHGPKRGTFPTTWLSLHQPPTPFANYRTQSWTGEMSEKIGFKPAVSCHRRPPKSSCFCLHCVAQKHSRKSKEKASSLSERLVGVVPGVRPLALPAHFGTFCKPENVARRSQLSVLLEEWRGQHFFEVSSSSSFLVCFHLI